MTPAEIAKELDEIETRLERLRIKYDQYFQGFEKMLPWVPRKDLDRRMAELHKEQIRNTGLRFRFQSLVQRYTMYQTFWGRIIRQIEEGTYKRDVVRARRLAAEKRAGSPSDGEELSESDLQEVPEEPVQAPAKVPVEVPAATTPATPQATVARPGLSPFGALRASVPAPAPTPAQGQAPLRAPAPARETPGAAEDPALRQLFQRYVEARRQTGESVEVKFETVARQVRDTLPRLQEKYQGADVRLDVAIKDGRAVLRPVVTLKR
ncbi:MAG: hypothetical protein HY909_08605 [Deltaproteobacteria bacterium]|nr:hypothetical protein [Deltaproteobacteria bacterium]